MKILGIIAEYNPFHLGHRYQIESARKIFSADYVIALMSGHFVQRGEPALYDSFVRTEAALRCGIDAVFEMPAPFSTASARDFASFGIGFFDALGIDAFSFGTEGGSLENLSRLAQFLLKEEEDFSLILQNELKTGVSFPTARHTALLSLLKQKAGGEGYSDGRTSAFFDDIEDSLSKPNTILAIEYLRAVQRLASPLKPIPILRKGGGYHDTHLQAEGVFSSASAIRSRIRETASLPESALAAPSLPAYRGQRPLFAGDLSLLLGTRLLTLKKEGKSLTRYWGISPSLEARIIEKSSDIFDYEELIKAIKSKNTTYTGLSRNLCHIALNIKKKNMEFYKEDPHPGYARLLGFRREALPLLTALKNRSLMPIISKLADAKKILSGNRRALSLLMEEVHAARIYRLLYAQKHHLLLPDIYRRSPIRL